MAERSGNQFPSHLALECRDGLLELTGSLTQLSRSLQGVHEPGIELLVAAGKGPHFRIKLPHGVTECPGSVLKLLGGRLKLLHPLAELGELVV